MKIKGVCVGVLTAVLAAAGFAQSAPLKNDVAAPENAVVGVWRAEADGLPFVTLTITNEGGSLAGAVLFYLHRRDPGQPMTSSPGIPEPLINPKFDGQTLTFEVSHKHAHPPKSLNDRAISFSLKLTGPNEGELVNEYDPSLAVPIVKDKY